ncbi:MAG: efflux RND transporter permease subunit [Treponema sp.]|nr:efflux RND transporter permease subunit [Treponema sp.]
MSMVKTVVSRPTTFLIIFILLIGLGFFALSNLPIDLYPEINPPYLVVFTTYTGAGPEEVERSVTRILEAALSGVSGIEKITSSTSKGSSMVIMEFTYGTDLAEASLSVRDALDRIRRYFPTEVDTPTIFKFDPSMIPIMGLMISGNNRTPEQLREMAEDTIIPRIEQTPGIATASVNGGREKIIRVEIPQNRLEAYGLTVTQIQQMLVIQNIQTSVGTITESGLSYILTAMGEYTSLDEIRNTVISYKGGGLSGTQIEMPRQVYLRDLADVFEGYRDETSTVYVNGQPAVMLQVQKQSGKNSVQAAVDLRERLKRMASEIPPDIKIDEIFNTTDIIENSLGQVVSTAYSGGILAVLILFIFLRSIKPTLIIGFSIPISILITLMLMYFAGLTLNLMTMAGLVLGIGMLVDNSIVILENIYHYREKGAKLRSAALLGTGEMVVAITASTLTTLCVFLPLVMFQGLLELAGELFAGLAFTVVISLAISLLTAIFLVPILSSHYLPLVTRKQKPLRGILAKIDNVFARALNGLDNVYRRAVARVLRHKIIVILFMLALFVGSMLLIPRIGWEFMPQQQEDNVSITANLPVGTPLEDTENILRQFQEIVERDMKGYDTMVLEAADSGSLTGNSSLLRINLPQYGDRILSANDIRNKLQPFYKDFPDALFVFSADENTVTITINFPDDVPLSETEETITQFKEIAERELKFYERLVLRAGGGGMFNINSSTNSGSLRLNLRKYKDRILTANEIKDKLRPYFNQFPDVSFNFGSGMGGMMGSGAAVDIILRTDNLTKGKQIGEKIAKLLSERIPEVTEPEVDLKDGLPQIELMLDRAKMYALGLNTYVVGNEIKAAVDGIVATKYKSSGHDYDVLLILAEADRNTRPALDSIFIDSQMAGRVPLSSFVHYVEGTGPLTIRRENQSRIIHVTAGAKPGTKTNTLQDDVEKLIREEIPVEDDVIIEFGGDNAEMIKMFSRFLLICIVAVFLVFGVMASLFESFRDPFIILFTIPLSLIGIVAIYLITNTIFNVLTAVGLLVLIGVIVNNGIILVDYTNLLRKRGLPLIEACIEAAGNRLRPILMTTLTTILGLLPMAFFPGEGSELVAPIGKTVLGGLTFGTLMTLFLMPTIYAVMNKRSDRRAAKAEARRDRIAAGQSRSKKMLSETADNDTAYAHTEEEK